ncbi:reverse transcriptase domain-containing protein [Serratia fonticola]|uniref:reverse transcriptase domain-containing protein n=1 Tax=Serratia fonticola TaxID=47917 RepID=UPI001C458AE1|nr:reverse transcriptase domain-containing protein [Serratia fonticola]QXN62765.1 transposase [Serratia fonticola]
MNRAEDDWQLAYAWLAKRRRHAPPNADVWHLRFHWSQQGKMLSRQVRKGEYRLQPMQVHRYRDRSWVQWCAQDALVLKWVALQVECRLPMHERCVHIRGRGGGRQSVQQVWQALSAGDYAFVYRTDIRGYYRHIRKAQVLSLVRRHLDDPILTDLIAQYLYYSVEDAGEFHTPEHGICRGCALSPLIAATLLYHVDCHFAVQAGIFYARYMDDFVLLTRTRRQLRRSVKQLHTFFNLGGFEAHPDKTQLGRIEHGFDWLGVWFTPAGTTIAPRALENHRTRRLRLYEQARRRGLSATDTAARVQAYEARWSSWAERVLE